jgi:hypothetical protein
MYYDILEDCIAGRKKKIMKTSPKRKRTTEQQRQVSEARRKMGEKFVPSARLYKRRPKHKMPFSVES